jgi:hypothetical protein
VFVVLTVLSARALFASAKEGAAALGRELIGLGQLTRDAEVLLVNGVRFHHAATAVKAPVSAVLDQVEAHCQRESGVFGEAMAELDQQHPELLGKHADIGGLRRGVFRDESDEHGMLVCFVGPAQGGVRALADALNKFISTPDLSVFGDVRYAKVRRTKSGYTQVAVLWTDGEVNLSKMFPVEGDAEGSDSRALPRPRQARRTLAAAAAGMPYGVRLYESRERPEVIADYYSSWMRKNGWKSTARSDPEHGRAFLRRDGYLAFVAVTESNGRSYVTLLEAGQADATAIAALKPKE